MITFAATGGMTVEAASEDEAREIFENEMQEDAGRELYMNGIDITEIAESDEED